jgi:hypothetical protein
MKISYCRGFAVLIYANKIILYNNLHHSPTESTSGKMADCTALASIPVFHESGNTSFVVQCTQLILGFQSPHKQKKSLILNSFLTT